MKWSLDKCLPDKEFKEMIKGGSPNSENEWRNSVRNINRDRKYKKEPTQLNTITEIFKDTHTHTHTHTHTRGNQC